MCVLCVISCVISRGGPDILPTTDFRKARPLCNLSSVLIQNLYSPYRYLTNGYFGCKARGCKSYSGGEERKRESKKEREREREKETKKERMKERKLYLKIINYNNWEV